MNDHTLRLGTRGSALALAQSGQVADEITRRTGRPVELVRITTYGDTSRESLARIGGTGVFVSALRDALLDGRVDLAVHSLKDLPTAAPEGLTLAAVPRRADPRDALLARDGHTLADLVGDGSHPIRVGTGATRRTAQLHSWAHAHGGKLTVVPIRGNVDTRIGYLRSGELDGVVLAMAGLARLGRLDEVTEVLEPEVMLPSPGQGALAVECAAARPELAELLGVLDDGPTRDAVTAERAVLATLEAGCSAPVGALATAGAAGELTVTALVGAVDGTTIHRRSRSGSARRAESLGRELAEELLRGGAAELMEARP